MSVKVDPYFETEIYPEPYYQSPSKSTWGMVISFCIGALGYIITLFENNLGYWILLLGSTGFALSRWLDYKKIPIKGKVRGSLKLHGETIEINELSYPVLKLENLSINYSTYRKQKVPRVWNMYRLNSGTENSISFRYEKKNYKYHFMIYGPYSKTKILEILESWYKQEISFLEYGDGRTYLGKTLSYEEIQVFKKKYNLHMNI